MKHKVISESKDGKRMMVVFYHEGESYTRHLRLENGKWMGVALPHHKTSLKHRLTSRNEKTVYSLMAYDFQRDQEGKPVVNKHGELTVIEWVPTFNYTSVLNAIEKAA